MRFAAGEKPGVAAVTVSVRSLRVPFRSLELQNDEIGFEVFGMAMLPTSQRRLRRILIATTTFLAPFLFGVAWQKREQKRTDLWVAEVTRLELPVEVEVDEQATSLVGRLRSWLEIPVVQVFIWDEGDANKLLQLPGGGPAHLQLHVIEGYSEDARAQLVQRFPRAEFRTISRWGPPF